MICHISSTINYKWLQKPNKLHFKNHRSNNVSREVKFTFMFPIDFWKKNQMLRETFSAMWQFKVIPTVLISSYQKHYKTNIL